MAIIAPRRLPVVTAYDPKAHGALCHLCPLPKTGARPVPPEPHRTKGGPAAIFVGEAPGRNEENEGRPFIGRTGKFLESYLAKPGINIAREACHLTNAALCRGERDEDNELAAQCCAPRLFAELQQLPPDVPIVTLGALAARSVLGVRSILVARGFIFKAKAIDRKVVQAATRAAVKPNAAPMLLAKAQTLSGRAAIAGRTVLPTLHPAFILRSDTWKPYLDADLGRAGRLVHGAAGDDSAGPQTVIRRVRDLVGLRREVALDIETDGLSPLECNIRTVQISDGIQTFVIFPWRDSMARPLARFLRNRRYVVGHNLFNFDQIVLNAHGLPLAGINWQDSLIGFHAYASHLRMGLDAVSSVYLDLPPWKLDHGKRAGAEEKAGASVDRMTASQLVDYGAADARINARLWPKMKADLDVERKVYEHDLKLAAFCRDMQITGIGFDRERQATLSTALADEAAGLEREMRKMSGRKDFSPTRLADVRRTLFDRLKAPALYKTPTGQDSTATLTLEALAALDTNAGKFARALLRWRIVSKVKATYVDAIKVNPKTGRVHYNWKPFGTVSGRLSSRLQSAPRHNPTDNVERIRELYIPAPGKVFVYHDVSQAEMRLAAYLSADPVFMAACAGDVHANNAKQCFRQVALEGWLEGGPDCPLCKAEEEHGIKLCSCPKKNPNLGKPYRDLAKNVGFAISYLAETDKVYATIKAKPEGRDVTYRIVDNMLSALRWAYRVYFKWVEANLENCRKVGHMRTPFLGRIRWLGYFPKVTEVANFPIQSGLADVMNDRTIALLPRLPSGAAPVAQVHDALIVECWERDADRVVGLYNELWSQPLQTAGGALVLPIDIKIAHRWSELG